jgi:ATP-binding cassette subfamily F protein 3
LFERIRKRVDGIEDRLADPSLYEKDPKAVTQLSRERSELATALTGHEETWLDLSTQYEEAMAQ